MVISGLNPSETPLTTPMDQEKGFASPKLGIWSIKIIIVISIVVFFLLACSIAIITCAIIGSHLACSVLLAPLILSIISSISLLIYMSKNNFLLKKPDQQTGFPYVPLEHGDLHFPSDWTEAIKEFDNLLGETQWKTTLQNVTCGVHLEKKHIDLPRVHVKIYYIHPPGAFSRSFYRQEYLSSFASRLLSAYSTFDEILEKKEPFMRKKIEQASKVETSAKNSALISFSNRSQLSMMGLTDENIELIQENTSLEGCLISALEGAMNPSYPEAIKQITEFPCNRDNGVLDPISIAEEAQKKIGVSQIVCVSVPPTGGDNLVQTYFWLTHTFRESIRKAFINLPQSPNAPKGIIVNMPYLENEWIQESQTEGLNFPYGTADRLTLAAFFKALLSLKNELQKYKNLYFKLIVNLDSLPIE